MNSIPYRTTLDELGRILIPKAVRKAMFFEPGVILSIFLEDGGLLLKRSDPMCPVCKELGALVPTGRGEICQKCFDEISQTLK